MGDNTIHFDIEKFKLPNNYIESCPEPPKKPKRRRIAGNFVKGPIPTEWLQKASALPGKAFQMGVVIWYLYGLRKDTTVTLGNGLLEQFHISRKARYRCLKALEGAGLIAVEYRKDHNPRVTIIAVGLEETAE
jgi:hypothetical protein